MTELHNMSVPPRTILTVRREVIRGRRYRIDLQSHIHGSRVWDAGRIRRDDGTYLLDAIDGGRQSGRLRKVADPRTGLKQLCDDAVRKLHLPDGIGFFVEEPGEAGDRNVPLAAAIAILASRSGRLYLPGRFEPSLITLQAVTLFFAMHGGER
jgi:hypothetical protein